MKTTRYEVQVHSFGKPPILGGPMSGCFAFPTHKWQRITNRPLGFRRARDLANEQEGHAVVMVWMTTTKVHDNGRRPELPAGWLPSEVVE